MDEAQSPPGIWVNRSATLCEQDAREAYSTLISSQLSWSFPEFVRNVQSQSPIERELGRAAVIEYLSNADPDVKILKSSKGLQCYLEETVTAGPRQRLFLLEDLSRNYIEILGSQLRIPPRFFGAHWADPSTPTFNHRDPFCRFAHDAFLVRYPSTQPVRVEAPLEVHGQVFHYNTNVNRHLQCYHPKSPIVDQPKSYHALSFWSSGVRNDGSWDCKRVHHQFAASSLTSCFRSGVASRSSSW
jgi:hypothetical protein